jgi:hypothetical protein
MHASNDATEANRGDAGEMQLRSLTVLPIYAGPPQGGVQPDRDG